MSAKINLKEITLRPCKLFIVNSLLFFVCGIISAQESSSKFWQNVRYGGGFGLGWSNNYFSATVAPSMIYNFNDYFAIGIGLNGTYSTQEDVHKSTILGGSLIALVNPFESMQLSAEFEELYVNQNFEDYFGLSDAKYWYPAFFLGVGYRSYNLTYGLRFDVLYDSDKSIYADSWMPFIRIYF